MKENYDMVCDVVRFSENTLASYVNPEGSKRLLSRFRNEPSNEDLFQVYKLFSLCLWVIRLKNLNSTPGTAKASLAAI